MCVAEGGGHGFRSVHDMYKRLRRLLVWAIGQSHDHCGHTFTSWVLDVKP